MGIFSYFARKAITAFPSYVKAPSSSSGLSSHSDSTDSENVESQVLVTTPTLPRQSMKDFQGNGINNEQNASSSFPMNDLIVVTMTPKKHVQFSSEMEQVHLIENFCNDPSLDLWLNRVDYARRYTTDLAIVRNDKSSPKVVNHKKKHPSAIGEHEYLTACNVAYHQFCLTGSVDKYLQRTLLIGISCGYRSLERFTSDHQLRRELSQRIRKSTVLLYQSLGQHRMDSLSNGTKDNTDVYLRAHIQSLNFHHIRWAYFLGRLDRMAERWILNTKEDSALLLAYKRFAKQREINSIPSDGPGCSKVTLDLPYSLENKIPANNIVQVGPEAFTSSMC